MEEQKRCLYLWNSINSLNLNIMNEDLNLLEILKDAPKGTRLYSTIWGDVELVDAQLLIKCITPNGTEWNFEINGKLSAAYSDNGECVLFPSKEQRDWSKFKLDLPIDTPVMVRDDSFVIREWKLRYYDKDNRAFVNGTKSIDCDESMTFDYIVPVKDFDFEDLESNKKRSIC